jgi:glutathione S-transferase
MTVRLYYAPGACSFIPHVALETVSAACGETFDYALVKLHKGEHKTPEYLAMNPDGQVPVLLVDGKPLTQILAILGYIDARWPKAGLLPADPWARAQTMSMLAWMNNTAHATFAHVFMPGKFTDDADAQAKVRAHAMTGYRAQMQRIQGWLDCAQPWLAGAAPGLVDAYVLTLFRWSGYAGIDPASLPALRDHVMRLAGQPAFAAAIAREKIDFNTYKPAAA